MQGLKIGDFGHFVFTNEYKGKIFPKDIEGAIIDDIDHLNKNRNTDR